MKKGYTLIELLVSTAMLGLLVIASVPFLIKVSNNQIYKENKNIENIMEFNEISEGLSCKSMDELNSLDNDLVSVKPVDGMKYLYQISGKTTKVLGYVLVKD